MAETRAGIPDAGVVSRWYLSVEGGLAAAEPTAATDLSSDKAGTIPQLRKDAGGFGAITFGELLDDHRDWRIRFAQGMLTDSATTDPSASHVASIDSKLEFSTADLEFGVRREILPATSLRLFAGLRALAAHDSAYASSDKSGTTATFDSSLVGLGPKVGADLDYRWAAGRWGVSAGTYAAAVFGARSGQAVNNTDATSWNHTEMTYNLGVALSVDYHPVPQKTLSIGVRADDWLNIRGENSDPALVTQADVFEWGPFVKFSWVVP